MIEIAEAIRADIVLGLRRTGSEIIVADLSEIHDAAMSDVRQALLRLAGQHLVTATPEGSFYVVEASRQDLHEVTAMRQILEGEAVRLAVSGRGASWMERVTAAYRDLETAGLTATNPGLDMAWRAAHTSFHEALCADCGNARLLAAVEALRDEAEIYRGLSAAAMTEQRRARVDREHRELLELALAGDPDGAAAKLRDHLAGTMQSVLEGALDSAEQ